MHIWKKQKAVARANCVFLLSEIHVERMLENKIINAIINEVKESDIF